MANDSSFDVVSRLDRQEVDNAVNQCAKEISQRYDFRGVGAAVQALPPRRLPQSPGPGGQGAAPLGQDLPSGLPAA